MNFTRLSSIIAACILLSSCKSAINEATVDNETIPFVETNNNNLDTAQNLQEKIMPQISLNDWNDIAYTADAHGWITVSTDNIIGMHYRRNLGNVEHAIFLY